MVATVFRSSDASAPVLTGQAGSMVALLDACLVNGYGSKAAAGWTIPYTAVNKRSYKTGRVSGQNAYLYVDDTTTGQASCRGYLNMAGAADEGTGPFPPIRYNSTFIPLAYIYKSMTADAVARPWTLIADDKTFYLFVECGHLASGSGPSAFGFGEFYSYLASDTSNFFISAPGITVSAQKTPLACINGIGGPAPMEGNQPIEWVAQGYSKQGGSVPMATAISGVLSGNTSQAARTIGIPIAGAIVQPNPIDGSIFMSPVYVGECDYANVSKNVIRGTLRGLYAPGVTLTDKEQITGSGALLGKTFLSVACSAGAQYNATSAALASVCFEISNAWDTN